MPGPIQDKWASAPLGQFLTFQRGFDITKAEQQPGPYDVISSSGPGSTHSEFKVKGPGVVIGRKGTLGTVFFSVTDFWPHDTTLWVKEFHGNDERFAYYFLQTLGLQRYDCGASNPTINRNHIHTLPVRFPPLSTQRKIAEKLSAYDELIKNNTRRIRILEEMAQTIYREWFVHFRFPGREKLKTVWSKRGPVPDGWGIVKVTEAVSFSPTTKVPKDGEKPFVPMNALSESSMLIGELERRSGNNGSKFMNGDTLLARITPCLENGKTAYVQFLPSGYDVAFGSTEFIVMRSRTLCPEYVYLLARSNEFRDHAIKSMTGATGRQRVQEDSFKRFLIAHPDGTTLKRFQEIVSSCFRTIQLLSQKNKVLRSTRDLLLPEVMGGKISLDSKL
jgi:type I restriction enzyme S subunit